MKIGLVLEGGAMRGMYTAGVLDVFLDNQIAFDKIVGVSAGALFGVNFLSRQKGRVIRYNKRFNPDRNYIGLLPLLREGNIVSTDYAYRRVPRELDVFDNEAFIRNQAATPFYAVITDMETGNAEYRQMTDLFQQMDILRASGSMPFVSRPVEIDGRRYLDGAVADSIPYRFLLKNGCERLVIVLTRDIGYIRKPMPVLPVRLYYRKYEDFAEKLIDRHKEYGQQIEEIKRLERDGTAFVLRPSAPINISKIEKNPEKLQAVYDLGKWDAEKRLSELFRFLELPPR